MGGLILGESEILKHLEGLVNLGRCAGKMQSIQRRRTPKKKVYKVL